MMKNNFLKIILLTIFFEVLYLYGKNVSSQTINYIPFEVIKEGDAGIEKKSKAVIYNESEFQSLLKKIFSISTASEQIISEIEKVDFDNYIVIGIFLGVRINADARIYCDGIIEGKKKIVVNITESYLGKNCIWIPTGTSLFQLIKLKKTNKKIIFKTKKVTQDC